MSGFELGLPIGLGLGFGLVGGGGYFLTSHSISCTTAVITWNDYSKGFLESGKYSKGWVETGKYRKR